MPRPAVREKPIKGSNIKVHPVEVKCHGCDTIILSDDRCSCGNGCVVCCDCDDDGLGDGEE